MESNKEQEIEIDLKEIFIILLDRIWIILASALVLAVLAGIVTKVFMTPMYSSTTKLYVINRQSEENAVTYSDLQSGSTLTQDFVIQVTGNKVMSQVIEELNLDTTESALADRIAVSNPDSTRYIVITVSDKDPVVAQQIAECVAKVSSEVGQEVLDIEKVNVAEEADLPLEPSSPNTKKNIVIGGLLGFVLAVGIIVVVHLMNDTIRTPEDVKKYLGLNTLGQIPVMETGETKKRGKKNKRKKKPDIDDIDEDEPEPKEEQTMQMPEIPNFYGDDLIPDAYGAEEELPEAFEEEEEIPDGYEEEEEELPEAFEAGDEIPDVYGSEEDYGSQEEPPSAAYGYDLADEVAADEAPKPQDKKKSGKKNNKNKNNNKNKKSNKNDKNGKNSKSGKKNKDKDKKKGKKEGKKHE
jgi:capsular polysaccharide biosynthesis protein